MKPEHEVLFVGLVEYPSVTAWMKGYDAMRFGEGIGACPYPTTHAPYGEDLQIQWFDGYQLALQEEKAKRMYAARNPQHFPFGIRPKR